MMNGMSRYARRRVARLLADERGQDLIEYALLTGIIAVVSALIGGPFITTMQTAYQTRNTNVNAIATPNAPVP
jgi:Flp pilus assembly pilin Flp